FAFIFGLAFASGGLSVAPAAERPPRYQVDPSWPKDMPNHYVMANVGGLAVDAQDHVWILSRPRNLEKSAFLGLQAEPPISECCRAAPAVVEFDASGNFIQAWGGPQKPGETPAYEWPQSEHGITVDHKGNVWVCGNGSGDNHCLKFTRDGKFLLQIGRSGASKGSLDPDNLNRAAQVAVWPKTNEVFIADGYGNRRVIVFDADSGKFKRMWGAYGNKPDDAFKEPDPSQRAVGSPPAQFGLVHGIGISKDGLVYVSDRTNNRVQVFTIEGKFVKEGFVARPTLMRRGTAFSTAFSAGDQRYLFVGDSPSYKVRILDRASLEEVSAFGRGGAYPGQFHGLHLIAADSQGNIYTGDAPGESPAAAGRVQKFVLQK
ncbi:MAG: hypothetical protein AB7P20_16510, partial [Rhizobiaceae bacterium]